MLAREPIYESPLADGRLQLQIVGLRWLLTALYPLLVWAGVIEVERAWFAASALFLATYHAHYTWYTWRELVRPSFPPVVAYAIPLLDTVAITLTLIAVGDPIHPIWGVYFFVIVAVAFFYHPIATFYLFWLVANYGALALALYLRGVEVQLPYMLVAAIILVLGIYDLGVFTSGERRLRQRLSVVARTDPLTGISNRRALEEALEDHMTLVGRRTKGLAVLMMDVDRFKRYNTQFGHLAADSVLEQLADLLSAAVREGDLVARYGGDEFVVVLPDVGDQEALQLANRLRRQVARSGLCTVCIGLSVAQNHELSGEALLELADAALLAAKEEGRNRVRAPMLEQARAA